MSINIQTVGKPLSPVPAAPRVDLQDWLVIVGFLMLEAGTALVYIPAALILAGLLLLTASAFIQAAKGK